MAAPSPNLPAPAGAVGSSAPGLPILRASETPIPATGERPPSPNFEAFGLFSFGSLDPGGYALAISAPAVSW